MKHRAHLITLLAATSLSAAAATPLWLRDARISPDGQKIAFTYMGDIYTVPTAGGAATRLTSQPGIEATPVWSPDSRRIAFRSDRSGNFDIYVMDADGGPARRLTTNSAGETPEAFSPDGTRVYFSASIQDPASSRLFPSRRMTELYSVAVDASGAPRQELATPAEMICFLPDGSASFVYQDQKGMENVWRKHHTSSITRDVWLYDASTGRHTNLTARAGEDRNPVVSPDGSRVYLLSERDGGSFNVWSFPIDRPEAAEAVTRFTTHPVRFLSMADNGTLAFTYDGELYTLASGIPEKVDVQIVRDEPDQPLNVPVGRRMADVAVSPDGTQVAIINRGDLFVASTDYKSTKRITDTPAVEDNVSWHPKGRKLVYVSERDGYKNLYTAEIDHKDDPNFSNATTVTERALYSDGVERTFPAYSPDGKKLAYIKNRNRLVVRSLDSGAEKELTDGSAWPDRSGGFTFRWSPDSRHIAFETIDNMHDPYTDIAIVDTESGAITNVTETAYFDEAPVWALDGNALMYRSDRKGMRNHASWGSLYDEYLVFLNRDAYDRYRLSEEDYALLKEAEKQQKKEKEKAAEKTGKSNKKGKNSAADSDKKDTHRGVKLEPEGITDRTVRLTPYSSDLSGAIITSDGETLYYLSAVESGYDLWKMDLRKREPSLVKKLDAKRMDMTADSDGRIYLLGSTAIKRLEPKGDKVTAITVSAAQKLDAAAEREAMFDYAVREEKARFYVEDMHGVPFDSLAAHYRRFLPHINNSHDFSQMLSELLGELNVSHTGSGCYSSAVTAEPTASLGLLFDTRWHNDGLRVTEAVASGPFDRASSRMRPGCIVEKINGLAITADADYTPLLNGIAGKKTLVDIYDPATGQRWSETILPIRSADMDNLLYERWVKRNEALVDSLSGGRLGYVHIRSMADGPFRDIYSKVLGKYNTRDGIVIDIRFNGGGRLHEDVEVLFSGHHYLTQEYRGQQSCRMPSRRWTKPSVMVVNEACYSNAHGTPWVYRHEGLGKIVGAPVAGTMTSVNWVTLQNPDLYFGIPVVGYRTAEGTFLENSQLVPDVVVYNDPADVATGRDAQLEQAVRQLLGEIGEMRNEK